MRITIEASEDLAISAIAYYLASGEPGRTIKSRHHFMQELREYARLFGESCVDDHQYEGGKYEQAKEIVDKYYKD